MARLFTLDLTAPLLVVLLHTSNHVCFPLRPGRTGTKVLPFPAVMASRILVADLCNQDGGLSRIRFVEIGWGLVDQADQWPGILGFYRALDGLLLLGPTRLHSFDNEKYHRAFVKGRKAALRVTQLLNGMPPTIFYPGVTVDNGPGMGMPFMRASDVAFVGGPPCEGHARDLEGISSFQKMEFHFAKASAQQEHGRGFTSTQFLHFSCPSLKADEVLFAEHGSPGFDRVEIVSGMCLFSAEIVRGSVLEDGRLDVLKLQYTRPTLYEMEYIARSSSVIADVASIIISRVNAMEARGQDGISVPVTINLDVPSFHYYQSIDKKVEQGLCTASEALQWIEAVDRRYDQVTEVFAASVRHELGRRGIASPHGCKIHVSPRTNVVASSIRQALQDGRSPLLDDVLQKLDGQEDGVWRAFYRLVHLKERPQDFRALGYLFYVFQVVRLALTRSTPSSSRGSSLESASGASYCSGKTSRPHALLISVDDGVERRIYSRAQKLLKKIRQAPDGETDPVLVETYLCRRVFINSNETGSNLYLDDPTPRSPVSTSPRRRKSDVDGGVSSPMWKLEPVDVVRVLYGSESARIIHKQFVKVGL